MGDTVVGTGVLMDVETDRSDIGTVLLVVRESVVSGKSLDDSGATVVGKEVVCAVPGIVV